MSARYDLAIVGAGPAGLACACLAKGEGLRVAVIEKQQESALAAPAEDGRDIALTHRSVKCLERLGVWSAFAAGEISPIRRASVRNGASADLLNLEADRSGQTALGFLVANHVIRGGLYRRAKDIGGIDLIAGAAVTDVRQTQTHASLSLSTGAAVEATLVAAADSRFSDVRRKAGIGAEMRDFGRVCIVCRVRHERAHDGTAYEWFDTDRTLAVLPLNDRQSSIVVTLPADAAAGVMGSSPEAFAADVERRFRGQWGHMELAGERHAYPLVAVYAHRFHAGRVVLVGDAAVGMHPVTAHGFNFGLRGADTLVRELAKAAAAGRDIGSESTLQIYDTEHRRATYPLYLATNAIVGLYTENNFLARIARDALLRVGNGLAPVKDLMLHKLTEIDDQPALAG